MVTTIVITISVSILTFVLGLAIGSEPYPKLPKLPEFSDWDYPHTRISRLEMENCQYVFYQKEYEEGRKAEQEKMSKKLNTAMKPLEELKEELTN